MPTFSVIVPVYNVEKYLHSCVDSVLCQSFQNFEILLIDDGSTDKSGEICDEYSKRDSRIYTIHQKNKGLGEARNAGILAAAGDWIIFLDSDDYWEAGALQTVVNKMEQWPNNPLYVCKWKKIYEYKKENAGVLVGVNDEGPHRFLSLKEQLTFYQKYCDWAVWKLVIKRSILLDPPLLFLKNVRCGEDIYWTIKLFHKINTLCFLDVVMCNYRIREYGTLSEESMDNAFRWMDNIYITSLKIETEIFDEHNFVQTMVSDKYVAYMIYAAQKDGFERWKNFIERHKYIIRKMSFFHASIKGKCCIVFSVFGSKGLWTGCYILNRVRKYIKSVKIIFKALQTMMNKRRNGI